MIFYSWILQVECWSSVECQMLGECRMFNVVCRILGVGCRVLCVGCRKLGVETSKFWINFFFKSKTLFYFKQYNDAINIDRLFLILLVLKILMQNKVTLLVCFLCSFIYFQQRLYLKKVVQSRYKRHATHTCNAFTNLLFFFPSHIIIL